ncbi:hypothetical protein PMAYCL1PPCAC_11474, partial [Pristionchus mayeri]
QASQCRMICLDEQQWIYVQSLPIEHPVIWHRSSFITWQWGTVQGGRLGLSLSRCWHLCECRIRRSCCWIILCCSSAVRIGAAAAAVP